MLGCCLHSPSSFLLPFVMFSGRNPPAGARPPKSYPSRLPYCAKYIEAVSKETPIFFCSLSITEASSSPSSCPSSTIIFACPLRIHFSDSVSIIVPPMTFTSLSSFLFPFVMCVMMVFTSPIRSIISPSDNSPVSRRHSITSLK